MGWGAKLEDIDDVVVDMGGRVWVTAPGINSVVLLEPARGNFNIRPVHVGFTPPLFRPVE